MRGKYIKIYFLGGKIKDGLIRFLKDEKGDGNPLSGLLWAAIIILAIIALKPLMDGAFTTFGTSFQTWLGNKAIQIFQ